MNLPELENEWTVFDKLYFQTMLGGSLSRCSGISRAYFAIKKVGQWRVPIEGIISNISDNVDIGSDIFRDDNNIKA